MGDERRDVPPDPFAEDERPAQSGRTPEPPEDHERAGRTPEDDDWALLERHDLADRRTRHAPRDQGGASSLFAELRELDKDSVEYAELRGRLVRMHLPLVEHLVQRYHDSREPPGELTRAATIGLIKSLDRFDPDGGVEFSTYATPKVVGEIKRHFRGRNWAAHVPRRLLELRLSLATATAELTQQHGRSPTVHELAERLGLSEREVLEGLESANAYSTWYLDVPDADDGSSAVADTWRTRDRALTGDEAGAVTRDTALPGRPEASRCRVRLTLLDDEPRAGAPVRVAVELVAEPGHPWARPGARPSLDVVAVPLSGAEVAPATVPYGANAQSVQFRVTAAEPGRHPIRFTFVHHDTGVTLQRVETDLEVAGAEPVEGGDRRPRPRTGRF